MNANRPNAQNEELQSVFSQLFRDQDKRPGGTAGELLREIEAGGALSHAQKAQDRANQLTTILSNPNHGLNRLDRAAANRVLNDLRYAIQQIK